MASIRPSRSPVSGSLRLLAAVTLPLVEAGPVAVATPRLHIAVDLNLSPDENDRRIAAWEARRERGEGMMRARPPGLRRMRRQRMLRNTNKARERARSRLLLAWSSPAPAPNPAPEPVLVSLPLAMRVPLSLSLPVSEPVPPLPLALLPPPVLLPPNGRQLRVAATHPPVLPLAPLLPPPPYLPAVPVPPTFRARRAPRAHLRADPPSPASASVRRSSSALVLGQSSSGRPATSGPKPLGGGSPEGSGRKRNRSGNAIGKTGADDAISPSPPSMLSREDYSGEILGPIRWANSGARSWSSKARRRRVTDATVTGSDATVSADATVSTGRYCRVTDVTVSAEATVTESGSSAAGNLENQPMRAIHFIETQAGFNIDMELSQAADPEADDRPLTRRYLSLQVIAGVLDLNSPPTTTGVQGRGRNRSPWDRLSAGLFNGLPGTTLAAAERTGTLSFFLKYAIRERTWLQENQLAMLPTKRYAAQVKEAAISQVTISWRECLWSNQQT